MVKKLLKQEYNYYIRTLIFILPAVIIFSIFVRLIKSIEFNHHIYNIIFGGTVTIFIISCIAALLVANLLGIIRFYKNMYSQEGYLTFSLPVSNHQHIISKLIAYILAIFLTGFVVIISLIIAFAGSLEWKEFFISLKELIQQIDNLKGFINLIILIIEIVILFLISLVLRPIQYYGFISIGQTAKKNRILLAIGAGYLYSVILQAISTAGLVILSILSSLGLLDWVSNFALNYTFAFIHTCMWIVILIYSAVFVLFYFINLKIMDKKLNLE